MMSERQPIQDIQNLSTVLEKLMGKKRILTVVDSRLFLRFSVTLVRSLIDSVGARVLYASIDMPYHFLLRLIRRMGVDDKKIYLVNGTKSREDYEKVHEWRSVKCVPGLFAPSILARTIEEVQKNLENDVVVVFIIGNASSMGFYASNDRIREFASKIKELTEKEERLKSVVIIDDANAYVKKIFECVCDEVIEFVGR